MIIQIQPMGRDATGTAKKQVQTKNMATRCHLFFSATTQRLSLTPKSI
jgi:hypothetical protein